MSRPRTRQDRTPSLTERRKAATQLDIARAAAELFADKGPDATTAEEIADRAGVALRTFYRYFRNKQDAVGPLLSSGGDRWRALLAETAPDVGLAEALESAAVASLTTQGEAEAEALRWTRGLLRAAQNDPALRAVWARVNHESELRLLPVLTRLAGPDADPLEIRLVAAAATSAIRVSLEAWAATDADSAESPAHLVVRCLHTLTSGLPLLTPDR
ncbi:TetR family transcriptional regulator [Actinomadura opuntiae]|uniref:TetR family transcriptional regulator n=1 Tax=Actinomadura sp. OS1-43 TaxID=604315 RepID=UPI00255B29D7|nr:TetR family transcriptional regulator [Actinomadura sp. OS1-43]MDL4819764.1 TetR family transcriptional regulator [Actinomadura sp. OS1-43]